MPFRRKFEVERIVDEELKATIYRLTGVLTEAHDCFRLLEMMREDISKGSRHAVFNLSSVDHVTSAGVGVLAACYTSATSAEAHFSIVSPSKQAETILKVSCLWNFIDHYDTEPEALKTVAKSSEP